MTINHIRNLVHDEETIRITNTIEGTVIIEITGETVGTKRNIEALLKSIHNEHLPLSLMKNLLTRQTNLIHKFKQIMNKLRNKFQKNLNLDLRVSLLQNRHLVISSSLRRSLRT